MFLYGAFQGLNDPSGVGAFQGSHAHDLAREVVNGHEDLNGPQAPAQDRRGVDRPDLIRIPGRDRPGFWFLLCFLRGGRGCRSVSGFRPLKNVSHGRGRDEDVQQCQLVGDSNPAPTEVGLGDLPHERGDLRRCLVCGSAGRLLIFDLVQPPIECGSGDAEIPGDLSSGDLEGLHMPEDEKPFADGVSWILALLVEVFLKDR